MKLLAASLLVLACLAWGADARGDDVRPASLEIREVSRGRYDVRFQTPMLGRRRLNARPRLPAGSTVQAGSYDSRKAGDSAIERFTFELPGGLIGRKIGVDGLLMGSRNAILRIRLLDGRDLKAVLGGGRPTFTVEAPAIEIREPWTTKPYQAARRGALHGALEPGHLLLVLGLLLVAKGAGWVLALGLFLLGDLAGTGLGWAWPGGPVPAPGFAEAVVALVACLAAREALLGRTRRLGGLVAIAGLVHGLALSRAAGGPLEILGHAFGLDLAHLGLGVLFLLVLTVLRRPAWRRAGAWAVGALAVAVAFAGAAHPDVATARPRAPGLLPISLAPGLTSPGAATARAKGLQTDLEAYLDVGVFDTRLEILARLSTLAGWLGMEAPATPTLAVADQPELLDGVATAILDRLTITVDGATATPDAVRAGFAVQEATGTYIRDEPVEEETATALVGVSYALGRPALPSTVEVELDELPPGLSEVRARVIDPEISREVRVRADAPRLAWTNELSEDPLPKVETIRVRRHPVPLPLLSLGLLAAGVLPALGIARRRGWAWGSASARVGVALAFLTLPFLTIDVSEAVGRQAAPTRQEARAIVSALIENVYRAFNVREEEAVYDRLASSLTETSRADAYMQNRRALAFARVGGARTHVDVVELRTLEELEPVATGGFRVNAGWTVAGSVTHFGHRHLRENLYRARLVVRPVEGAWKIDTFEIEDLTRER